MKLGLHVADFTWPNGPRHMAEDLTRIATVAEDVGFSKLSVMDHVWQIGAVGSAEQDMLEAYTTLGYLAARTSKIDLLAWVTAVVYREPGLLAKCVTTLDVLSGGRAWLGIAAAWNEAESRGIGLPFPPTAEVFERYVDDLPAEDTVAASSRAARNCWQRALRGRRSSTTARCRISCPSPHVSAVPIGPSRRSPPTCSIAAWRSPVRPTARW